MFIEVPQRVFGGEYEIARYSVEPMRHHTSEVFYLAFLDQDFMHRIPKACDSPWLSPSP